MELLYNISSMIVVMDSYAVGDSKRCAAWTLDRGVDTVAHHRHIWIGVGMLSHVQNGSVLGSMGNLKSIAFPTFSRYVEIASDMSWYVRNLATTKERC